MSFDQDLRRRLVHYLDLQTTERRGLSSVVANISASLPDTVIFGGMLREFALGNARKFTSDIDLVSAASSGAIAAAIADYLPTRNKFGGFRFTVNQRRFDIWALQDTWAFKRGHAGPPSFENLLKTSFFNLDAAFFHLGSRQVTTHEGYEQWIATSLLEISLEPNLQPANMVRRALDLVINNQLTVGHRLAQFLAAHANEQDANLSWLQATLLNGVSTFAVRNAGNVYKFQPQNRLLVPG
jgi:hypothetical protein